MKKLCLIAMLAFDSTYLLLGQDTPAPSNPETWVLLNKPQRSLNVDVNMLKDSSIMVYSVALAERFEIPVNQIHSIHWTPKGQTAKGAKYGLTIGLGVGFLVGIALSYESKPDNIFKISPLANGALFSMLGGLSGVFIGGIASSIGGSIYIEGSQAKYERQKEAIRRLTGN